MNECFERCFVCGEKDTLLITNLSVNLPVCLACCDSPEEKSAISLLQQGLAEGFVCGCI